MFVTLKYYLLVFLKKFPIRRVHYNLLHHPAKIQTIIYYFSLTYIQLQKCKYIPNYFYVEKHVSAKTGSYHTYKYFTTAYRPIFSLPFSIHNYSRILYL